MSITISNFQLKTAGISFNKESGGFLLFRVLKKTGSKSYSILLNGKILNVKSEIRLNLGEVVRAEYKNVDGKLLLKILLNSKQVIHKSYSQILTPMGLFNRAMHRRKKQFPKIFKKRY